MKRLQRFLLAILYLLLGFTASAFKCGDLYYAKLPDGTVEVIEADYSHLHRIEIPAMVTSSDDEDYNIYKVSRIGNAAFNRADSLEFVSIAFGIESVGDHAFSSCSMLSDVILPASIRKMETYCFAYCPNLKTIVIPDAVDTIPDYAFCNCPSLETVEFGKSVSYIGHWAFSECSSLANLNLPESLRKIDVGAFCYCVSLKSLVIPDGVEEINNSYGFYEGVFQGCTSLESEATIDARLRNVTVNSHPAQAEVELLYVYTWGSIRCSPDCDGQCESSEVREGQQAQTPRAFRFFLSHTRIIDN